MCETTGCPNDTGRGGGFAMAPLRFAACAAALVTMQSACPTVQAGQVQGLVGRVDVVNVRLQVVQPGGREYTFACRPGTPVTLNGEPFAFDLLGAGWRVAVRFDDRTGEVARIEAFR